MQLPYFTPTANSETRMEVLSSSIRTHRLSFKPDQHASTGQLQQRKSGLVRISTLRAHYRKKLVKLEEVMEQLGLTIAECGPFWKDPIHMRSNCVRALRLALRQWAHEVNRMKNVCVELSTAVQNCARLEQSLLHNIDIDIYQSNQDQVASLLGAAESIMAVEEMHNFMAERNRAALDASNLLFGSRGVIKLPEICVGCQIPRRGNELTKPIVKPMTDGWQPRWPGDLGDPFEPYLQLIEQYLHSAVSFHARALEQLSAAFGHVRRASKNARDLAYLHSLAAAVGLSVKEYQRLLEMFNKIDIEKVGTISKRQLMDAMKRDKDIAAFMQLSRAKNKDGKRETFEGVFNRIDTEGLGAVTWESFLHFFSSERSLTSDAVMNPMCVQPMCTQPLCVQAAMCNQPLCKLP